MEKEGVSAMHPSAAYSYISATKSKAEAEKAKENKLPYHNHESSQTVHPPEFTDGSLSRIHNTINPYSISIFLISHFPSIHFTFTFIFIFTFTLSSDLMPSTLPVLANE
jgi:hypothetical protein